MFTWTKQAMLLLALLALAGGFAGVAVSAVPDGQRVGLEAALNRDKVLAGQRQTAYLQIGLRGFEIEDRSERPDVNLALVIDRSGSMQGQKIRDAREAAIMALDRLRASDIVSVVAYESTVQVVVPATRFSDRAAIYRGIRGIEAGGSTALFGGVSKGAAELRKFIDNNKVNRLVLLSDGLANVGPQSSSELGRLGAALAREGITVSTIGLGNGYNEDLMTELALRSDGRHYFAEEPTELAGIFDKEFGETTSIVARGIEARIICADGVRPLRVLGRDARIDGKEVAVAINNLASGMERQIVVEVELEPGAEQKSQKVADVSVDYENLITQKREDVVVAAVTDVSRDRREVEQALNREVEAEVVRLKAIETNEEAIRLRDEGKVEESQQLLYQNRDYLQRQSQELNAPSLAEDAMQNEVQAENLDEEEWKEQRKRSFEWNLKSRY